MSYYLNIMLHNCSLFPIFAIILLLKICQSIRAYAYYIFSNQNCVVKGTNWL